MIELINVFKRFKTKNKTIQALSGVSLTVDKGEIFGVIGASGAGKSTLIRCVNLLERPNEGQVIVDNVELTKLSDAQLTLERRKIAMIFQHFNLLSSRTVFDNVVIIFCFFAEADEFQKPTHFFPDFRFRFSFYF